MASNWSLSDWDSRQEEIKSFLSDLDNWEKIPFINVIPNHDLQDHQLVRFRGMIQHMYNPEYFLGQFEVVHNETNVHETRTGWYRDIIQCSSNETLVENSKKIIEERQVLYCISIPALNDWVQQQQQRTAYSIEKNQEVASTSLKKTAKRSVECSEPMEVDTVGSCDTSSGSAATSHGTFQESKRLSTEASKDSKEENTACPSFCLNFPIDGASGMACIVKTYDSGNLPSLKLNDVIDVVGFLSLDPSLAETSGSNMEAERSAEHLPPSIVPRLHALAVQKLTHVNQLPSDLDEVFQSAENTRKELHLLLSQMLLGDTLAAEYMICHLISLVYLRKEGLALGHFSVNLSNLPQRPDYTRLLYSVLQRILPKSHYLPMTIENMNTLSFVPKMDYESNHLSSGLLQLSDNTHLVVDETRLEEGKLDAAGVKNVEALRTLICHQLVNYDFQYYSKPYDADVPVLILSEGKSLLPHDVLLPMKADISCLNTLPEIFQAANHFLRDPLLSAIRLYLCAMRHSCHEFPEYLQKKAQEDFVEMRRVGGQNVSADDLHILLVLARLVSLCNGEKVVSVKAWDKAKQMEDERKKRICQQRVRPSQPSNEP